VPSSDSLARTLSDSLLLSLCPLVPALCTPQEKLRLAALKQKEAIEASAAQLATHSVKVKEKSAALVELSAAKAAEAANWAATETGRRGASPDPATNAQVRCVSNQSVIFSLGILNIYWDSLPFRSGSIFFTDSLETHRTEANGHRAR
jgi:hypothetical protein